VLPDVNDLTGKRIGPPPAPTGPNTGEFPTGAWGDESRDFHVAVDVRTGAAGEEMLAARVALVVPAPDGTAQVASQGLVRAVWTDDEALSTRINPQVAHYTGQAELAAAIQEGLQARRDGDEDTATTRLGRAVKLAHESGNADMAKLLEKVVDVEDLATGTVRLKKAVADADEMALDTRSTKTARVGKTGPVQR
jgi:VWA domain-containing protein